MAIMRTRVPSVGCVITIIFSSVVLLWCYSHWRAQYGKLNAPVSLSAGAESHSSRFDSWDLTVTPDRHATLVTSSYRGKATRTFVISRGQWRALHQSLLRERFFDLAGSYGDHTPEEVERRLSVTMDGQSKTVRLHTLDPGSPTLDAEELRAAARALRILSLIRSWVRGSNVIDMRPADQRVLDAAK